MRHNNLVDKEKKKKEINMPTNTCSDQIGTVITTEFGTSPLSFPKGVANVAPYVYGVVRTYAGVTEGPETLDGPFDEVAPVKEETSAPVRDALWHSSDEETEEREIEAEVKAEGSASVVRETVSTPVEETANAPKVFDEDLGLPLGLPEETATAPVVSPYTSAPSYTPAPSATSYTPATSVVTDAQSEVKKIEAEVKAEAEKIAEEAKDIEEKIFSDVEAAAKDIKKAV